MKKHIYLFDESNTASVYGVGTYIQQMINCLLGNTEIALHVVHIGVDIKYFEIRNMQGYDSYNIPQSSVLQIGGIDKYLKGISYLIRLNCHLPKDDSIIFLFNYFHHLPLIHYLKLAYPSGIFYFVVHYQNLAFNLVQNILYLKKIICTEDSSTLSLPEQEIYHSFQKEKYLYQVVDRVICVSRFTLSILKDLYEVPSNKLNLVYNGLKDETCFSMPDRNTLRTQYRFSIEEKIILFVGRLNLMKGIDLLIKAFQIVLNQYSNCRLVIVGDGDFSFCFNVCGSYWSKITFTGLLSKKQVYDFYQMADVGVIPSKHEQCSYVAIEMMMFGLPMVVSDTIGLKEMVEEGDSGYIFDWVSSNMPEKELANLILKILKAPLVKLRKMQKKSRFLYEEKYTIERMRNNYLRLI